jgi:hypothetical protein
MSIKSKKLKNVILNSGKKVGLLVAEDGPADKALTRGTDVAANVINEGEKQGKKLVKEARSALDELRAKIHAATAPAPKKKKP